MRWRSVLAGVVVLWAAPRADASNQDSIFLGNEAAMTGGAVTAVTQDPSAAWYNPAGLAGVRRNAIDLSASAFILRRYSFPGLLRAELSGGPEETETGITELLSVPSALVFVRALSPDLTAAVGIFVREQGDLTLQATLAGEGSPAAGEPPFRHSISITEIQADYFFGPAIGWKVTPTLRVGLSALGFYGKGRGWVQAATETGISGAGTSTLTFTQFQSTLSQIGARLGLGLQWQPFGRWVVGLSLKSPVVVFTSSEESQSIVIPPDGGGSGSSDAGDGSGLEVTVPSRIHLGVAYTLDGGWIALEADFRHALAWLRDDVTDRSALNLRLGGRVALNDSLSVGAGVFSDRSPREAPDVVGELAVDYYGISGGLELKTRFDLVEAEETDDVIVSSTLAARYAIGLGETGSISYRPSAPPGEVYSSRRIDVTFHELSVHVGSALHF